MLGDEGGISRVEERERGLLGVYGRWRKGESDEDPAQLLIDIVATLLVQSVSLDSIQTYELGDVPALAYEFEGRDYLLLLAGHEESSSWGWAILTAEGRMVRGEQWAVLYWPADQADDELVRKAAGLGGAVLDRTHLDAAAAGVCALTELVRRAVRRQEFYLPLAELLGVGKAAPTPEAMVVPARLTSPVAVETRTWAGTTAEVLLIGPTRPDRPTGLACLPQGRVLITCADGLLEVDTASGQAHWHLMLPGCHGAALVCRDGGVLVLRGSSLIRWHEGRLHAVAGDFDDSSVLLAGPDGEPWVLSGSGVTFGVGEGDLALVRAGDTVGGQMPYPIHFPGAVRSAVWLERRRFFLAASGHSTVMDLARSTDAGQREDWIRTPVHFPAHVLRADATSVLSASPDGTGTGIAVHRTDVVSRTSEPIVEARLGELFGFAQAPDSSPAYLLASLPSNDHTQIRPVLLRLTGNRPAAPRSAPAPTAYRYDVVSQTARGERGDYALEPRPLDPPGGQAEVFPATHKPSGTVVAFKRRSGWRERGQRRMRREVEAAQRFGDNPHVMPVLDFHPGYAWFVMPKAEATVEDKRTELQDPDRLRPLVEAVAAGLADAHREDWIHRDIKPANILLLEGRWVVADWGIVRRPRGQTSTAGLLTTTAIGTEGFAAPEQFLDGHDVSPASDIYSLGQLIGWILTGIWPQANVPLLPDPGPWYGVVRQATQLDPARRPQDMAAFLGLVERETGASSELPIVRARRLLEDADQNDTAAAAQLLALAADQPGSSELYLDVITRLNVPTVKGALLDNPTQTATVVHALTQHAAAHDWPSREEADRALWWLLDVARLAGCEKQWALLDIAVQGMCDWDGRFDRWSPRDDIKDWMRELTGHAASIVASALRAQPAGARLLCELAEDRRVDQAIRSAVYRH
ncbi:serine/threonine protein kinase [Streptomyces sp. NBC_00820]|uniref:serine/threonine-protein kinase n=1 Tax=Streptomyces sp. NBC_00820 TaxID=2975842 RepID=UPI002ED411E7|nr:serine/threonine protein kinase [Streptomyces sp. NBC_00820]WTI18086.1 serine/threonine protein kinase [Streptomyces sp. NBC_00820]